jgi:hypothetical protein
VFPYVIVAAAPDTVTGEDGGNHVVVASESPLPVGAFVARLATRSDWRVMDPERTAEYATGGQILTDDFAPVDQLITHR